MAKRPCSRVFVVDHFFQEEKSLRKYFSDVFSDPRGTDSRRFCWDFWNVPGQYRLLRTPAYHFFPKALYQRFHQELVQWGRRNLGCHDISPPWLSCYVDGCEQNLHGDLPHGPWSFVFSLTPWKGRVFRGGETLLLREEVLDFWGSADLSRGMEERDLLQVIEPRENRLVVFDPRIPHGVRRVVGAQDVLEGRLVIHGWFVNPRPFIEGPLKAIHLRGLIERILKEVDHFFEGSGVELDGMASFRLRVARDGRVSSVEFLAHNLRSRGGDSFKAGSELVRLLERLLSAAAFPRQAAVSTVTLPFIFMSRPETAPGK